MVVSRLESTGSETSLLVTGSISSLSFSEVGQETFEMVYMFGETVSTQIISCQRKHEKEFLIKSFNSEREFLDISW